MACPYLRIRLLKLNGRRNSNSTWIFKLWFLKVGHSHRFHTDLWGLSAQNKRVSPPTLYYSCSWMKCYCTPANSLFLLNHFGYVAASPFIVVLVWHPLRPPLPSRTFACFNRRSKSASIDSACASLRVQCMHRTSTLLTRLILCSEYQKSQCFGPTISCGLLLTFDISDVNCAGLRW